jgi:hypothetical protein
LHPRLLAEALIDAIVNGRAIISVRG